MRYSKFIPPLLCLGVGLANAVPSKSPEVIHFPECKESFSPVSAETAFAALNPGWNAGNTLDATPGEGDWGGVDGPLSTRTMDKIKASGFKSIRVPVTWADHFTTGSPTWNVNSTWMDRVETVVDQIIARDMYVIINVHHDSWIWADGTLPDANLTMINEKFTALWGHIASRFKCKSHRLILEPINEPRGTTAEDAAETNKMMEIFLVQINKAGGYNPKRVVSLSGLRMDSYTTEQWFVRPSVYPDQPWGFQFHYYSPFDLIFGMNGKTIWGSPEDKAAVYADLSYFRGNFSDIPTFIGEYGIENLGQEHAAKWRWYDYFIRTAQHLKFSTIVWDNGYDLLDRASETWRDPVIISVLNNAINGTKNTLPDSTTDINATSQNTSAYVFHKAGAQVVAQTVNFLLGGNSLRTISTSAGHKLAPLDYSFSAAGGLTLSAAFLRPYFASASAGIKETLTLTFSSGTFLHLDLVVYSTPKIQDSSYSLKALSTTINLDIPITYAGLPMPAAFKMVYTDGSPVLDQFTASYPPLQQGRTNWGGGWNFNDTTVTVEAAVLSAIKNSGKNATVTVEFWPRDGTGTGSNSVSFTITQ